ncbi:hypothetical protein B0J13DRAFT_621255 [Dactylonectria estremocensis]|uniref:Uncharacterized protein n=1 Tax=Dactylonectria estremocensis TaxID=1079267 RepID=A0A9P9J8J2_9HYPO|nr:hypothetical protein B0J13DRAFT_621255 [Dactylonectria estremocensis]
MDASSFSSTSSASSAQQSPTVQMAPQPVPAPKTSSTDIFLKEFNLVAEAAKRAQMAVMVRDFEEFGSNLQVKAWWVAQQQQQQRDEG